MLNNLPVTFPISTCRLVGLQLLNQNNLLVDPDGDNGYLW
jgi:hypothetical protein